MAPVATTDCNEAKGFLSAQCSVENRLAQAFVGTLVVADGESLGTTTRQAIRATAIGATAPSFPIAVQATCDLSGFCHFCHRAEYPVAVLLFDKKNQIADDLIQRGSVKGLIARIGNRARANKLK